MQSISISKIYFSHIFYLEFIWNNLFIFTQMHNKHRKYNNTVTFLFCRAPDKEILALHIQGKKKKKKHKSTLGHFPLPPLSEHKHWH